jgi:hypothetical protein
VVCVSMAGRAQAEQNVAPVDPAAVPPVAGAFPAGPETPGGVPQASAGIAPAARTARNSIFIELAGNGGIYSLNYDRVITEQFSVRAGFGYMSMGATASSGTTSVSAKASILAVPVVGNFLLGSQNHKLELGAGITMFRFSGDASNSLGNSASATGMAPAGTAVIGYRYVPGDGGFTFRAGFTPLVFKDDWLPWGGLSFGYLF